ncbi:MAG: Ribonuclease 3 [Candidatus Jorgensenbacteria bacterium GW2011_GWA1_48_11]|uniref:Ribonuclease 3 n=1 Tax=Candidatus Jorgensenbacteria bacterium GW2011_GWA1_48_11 TaxID=1618660 RepID=A0A0G1U9N5_9BACT|nr:MAG: Ribonuclease 3 [Candidatus Jorgensenbacteria bacterium GW2011_GWA1_48_11]KKW12414.1 MAG: Ribonuclease 3 [Candidatus Jorgensenbacteria bacterium GW2011_GWB1_49_9]
MADLEEKLGIRFKNKNLLKEALTHRSYLNENPSWPFSQNERLEYLGDAVLELAVSEHLYKNYPDYQEGWLTSIRAALVNYQMLARIAREIFLEEHILLSRGETKDTGKAREVIMANAFEALVGAIYLDQDFSVTKTFIEESVLSHLPEVIEKGLYRDPKSLLQEIVQERLKLTPTYKILKEEGPDHNKKFEVGVFFGDELIKKGVGSSKQEAEVNAAEVALRAMVPKK